MNDPRSKVNVRPDTRPKLELIAEHRRWTYTELVDAIADHYIDAHLDLKEAWERQQAAPNTT